MSREHFCRALGAACILGGLCATAPAADGFKVRYPLSGSLGGEIVAQFDSPGWFASVVATQIEIDELTDGSGKARQQTNSGVFSTPTPVAGAVRTANYSGTIGVDLRQSQTNANLILGYLTEKNFGGGHLAFALNLPYTTRLDRTLGFSGTTPTLSTLQPPLNSPPLPAGTAAAAQARAQAGFDTAYQANLAAQSDAASGVVSGLGDAELSAAWVFRQEELKLVAGLTLVVPTGQYDAASQLNIGFGDFYTLRPGLMVSYSPAAWLTLGVRGSLAFNTRNKDNQIKSGDFGALDMAAAFRTPIGVFGPHVISVSQFSDDEGGNFGANRFSATGVGAFYTVLIPGIEAALNLSWMQMVQSKNALSGSFYQVRLSKAF
jgi:hypothetical protein